MVVDLPAPFSQKKKKREPCSTSKEMLFTAVASPYCLTKLLTSIAFFISDLFLVNCFPVSETDINLFEAIKKENGGDLHFLRGEMQNG